MPVQHQDLQNLTYNSLNNLNLQLQSTFPHFSLNNLISRQFYHLQIWILSTYGFYLHIIIPEPITRACREVYSCSYKDATARMLNCKSVYYIPLLKQVSFCSKLWTFTSCQILYTQKFIGSLSNNLKRTFCRRCSLCTMQKITLKMKSSFM